MASRWLELDAATPLGATESRELEGPAGGFRWRRTGLSTVELSVAGIGRDQDEPVDHTLADWLDGFCRPGGLDRTHGTTWTADGYDEVDRVHRDLSKAGVRVTQRRLDTGKTEDGGAWLWKAVADDAELDVSAWWTWMRLQVEHRGADDRSGRRMFVGYDFMSRGDDRRHRVWEEWVRPMLLAHGHDPRFAERGSRLLVSRAEALDVGRLVCELDDPPFMSLAVTLRPA